MSATMRAILVDAPGGPEVLRLGACPAPTPGPGEALIDVYATAVNRADLLQRAGKYPPPPGASPLLGLEIAGRVAALGPGATGWAVGDRVCALLPGGGYAEQAVVPAALLMPLPDGFTLHEAAALPEVWMTAYDNLFNWARLAPGETALIHGGSSGVGSAALQLARWRGATPYATASSPAKLAACRELGAAAAFDYRAGDWAEALLAATGGHGADVVLDMVGGAYLGAHLGCLAPEGRLVVIATQGGAKAELDLRQVMAKRLSLMGTTLRPRSVEAKAALARQLVAEIWPELSARRLRPVIDRVLPLEEAATAHRLLADGAIIGKIVLAVRAEP